MENIDKNMDKNTIELICPNCGEIFIHRCKNKKIPSNCSYCYGAMRKAREQQIEAKKQRIEDEKWRNEVRFFTSRRYSFVWVAILWQFPSRIRRFGRQRKYANWKLLRKLPTAMPGNIPVERRCDQCRRKLKTELSIWQSAPPS